MPEIPEGVACSCARRVEAMNRGEFVPMPGGWIFTDTADCPARRVHPRVAYLARERSETWENHGGEPVRFTTCVFCGYELPRVGPPTLLLGDPEQ